MARGTEVPITPSVLEWAINESGYDAQEIAHAAGVDLRGLRRWLTAESRPNLTQARKLAAKLHRPFASLLLPGPPEGRIPAVDFRHPADTRRPLNPSEYRYLRRAGRLQKLLSWIARQMETEASETPAASIDDEPSEVAIRVRSLLGVSPETQRNWSTPSEAFDEWRSALEKTGHLVFLFSLGKNSCSGFSLWNELAPIVCVNTAWNEAARIFTLFHEFGHLITRTDSACVESLRTSARSDPVERWCERFAADVLMPVGALEVTLRQQGWRPGREITDLRIASYVATLYKVSLRAAVIRLIELDAATWTLYNEIPPVSDHKPATGGGRGRDRTQIREDQLGNRTTSLLVTAVERDVLNRSQAVEFLDIPDTRFDELTQTVSRLR